MNKSNKILRIIDSLDEYVIAVGIALITFMVTVQIPLRFFDMPLIWSEELARYLFVWITLIGIGYGVKKQIHVRMEFFFHFLPKKLQDILSIILNFIAIFSFLYIVPSSFSFAVSQTNILSAALQMPMFFLIIFVPISMVLVVIRLLIETVQLIKRFYAELRGENI
ncbi:TRAP transporter small permease [Ammoniphilus resinae]|uniref:TRAP-type C4-dicarboxylate transport system permease small subunit n=1 Tax=Ammoniphilus resinae TaxID=861532 RepID=A0ABS4GSU0_9BACL|nr:TRAP transporter small permease [Ammoniphilus resinae]MBP1933331.1 TRAP-type C4-dicarboxylate transport system permease small subunit [Ammoniphilus resinae]